METLELFDSQPDDVFIDRHAELGAQGPGRFPRSRLSIALFPDQRRGAVEAMRLVSLRVVDKYFIIQLADYEILGASTR